MERLSMIKAAWNGGKATLTTEQKKLLGWAFEIAAELGIYGERENFFLVLDFFIGTFFGMAYAFYRCV